MLFSWVEKNIKRRNLSIHIKSKFFLIKLETFEREREKTNKPLEGSPCQMRIFTYISFWHYVAVNKSWESESHPVVSDSLRHMDYTIHEILQARIPEWVAIPFSRGSFQPRDGTHKAGRFFTYGYYYFYFVKKNKVSYKMES